RTSGQRLHSRTVSPRRNGRMWVSATGLSRFTSRLSAEPLGSGARETAEEPDEEVAVGTIAGGHGPARRAAGAIDRGCRAGLTQEQGPSLGLRGLCECLCRLPAPGSSPPAGGRASPSPLILLRRPDRARAASEATPVSATVRRRLPCGRAGAGGRPV